MPATIEAPLKRSLSPGRIGDAPLVVAVDQGSKTTRVQASRGAEVIGQRAYPTPARYPEVLFELIRTKQDILGVHTRPDAFGLSVAGKVSMAADRRYVVTVAGDLQESVDEPFADGLASAVGLLDSEAVVVFGQGGGGAYAEMTVRPNRVRDEAFFTIDGTLDGAIYTPADVIIPDTPDQAQSGDLLEGIAFTLKKYSEANLFVGRVSLASTSSLDEQRMEALAQNLQREFGITKAPKIVVARLGVMSPLVGAERAAERLKRSGQRPNIDYNGLRRS